MMHKYSYEKIMILKDLKALLVILRDYNLEKLIHSNFLLTNFNEKIMRNLILITKYIIKIAEIYKILYQI